MTFIEYSRLVDFIMEHCPEEVGPGETAVAIAIRWKHERDEAREALAILQEGTNKNCIRTIKAGIRDGKGE